MKAGTLAVLGPGLLGGSLLLAFRERHPAWKTVAWARRRETVEAILSQQLAGSATTSEEEAVAQADVVVVCTPIEAMADLGRRILPALQPGTLVTDVGSVKAPVEAALGPLFQGRCRWIGSHPMAGSEHAGLAAARSDLYNQARVILTPTDSTDPSALADARNFWSLLGCRVFQHSPQEHDRLVAQISHLPHALASLLTLSVEDPALELAGPGFRDTTRVAAGPAALWRPIFLENRREVLAALDAWEKQASAFRTLLEKGDGEALEAFLSRSSSRRKSLNA
jgi:prephenate dehydrogenase